MITLSLNFDGLTGKTARSTHEKKVRQIVDTHFSFPGSDKLKMGVTVKDNGSSSVTFAGPKDIVDEAKRLWRENGQPTADRLRTVATRAVASVKKKASSSVKKAKVVAPKKKKVHVTVKAKATKKTTSTKRKKK